MTLMETSTLLDIICVGLDFFFAKEEIAKFICSVILGSKGRFSERPFLFEA